MLIVRLCVLLLVLVPVSSYAQVLATFEWESSPNANWSPSTYTLTTNAGSPSGGNALVRTVAAGTYSSSQAGGTLSYSLPGNYTELYIGHWVKYSSNYVFNPNGNKFDYVFTQDTETASGCTTHRTNSLLMFMPYLQFTQQVCANNLTDNRYANISAFSLVNGTWYWVEEHLRMNTVGQANGLVEVWINDVLRMQHNNVTLRTSNTVFRTFQHAFIWGGLCNACTIPTITVSYDHTVISTARIGMPGGTPPPQDTTAPTAPSSLVAQ